jgi:hypothetical protein
LGPGADIAAMFFSLDESAGFAVAGGAALIARALVDRSTRDVDLFTVTDVRDLANVYPKDELLRLARVQDAGFDLGVFADMIETAGRYSDDELSLSAHDVAQLRQFFRDWREELQNG